MFPMSPLGWEFDGKCLQFVVLKVSIEAPMEAGTVRCKCVANFLNKHTNLHIPLAVIPVLFQYFSMYWLKPQNLSICLCSFVAFYITYRIRSVRKVPKYPICTICVSWSISPSPSLCLSVLLPIFICFLTTAYLFLRVSVRWVRSPCIFVLFVKTLEEAL